MSEQDVTLRFDDSGKEVRLPVLGPTVGPRVVDIRRLYRDTGHFTFDPGYLSTASCESKITYIDGEKGILLYRGYPIEQLAETSTFLEVCYLLLYGELPTQAEYDRFVREVEEVGETAPQSPFSVTGVPEPEEWLLLALAAAMLVWYIRTRRVGHLG